MAVSKIIGKATYEKIIKELCVLIDTIDGNDNINNVSYIKQKLKELYVYLDNEKSKLTDDILTNLYVSIVNLGKENDSNTILQSIEDIYNKVRLASTTDTRGKLTTNYKSILTRFIGMVTKKEESTNELTATYLDSVKLNKTYYIPTRCSNAYDYKCIVDGDSDSFVCLYSRTYSEELYEYDRRTGTVRMDKYNSSNTYNYILSNTYQKGGIYTITEEKAKELVSSFTSQSYNSRYGRFYCEKIALDKNDIRYFLKFSKESTDGSGVVILMRNKLKQLYDYITRDLRMLYADDDGKATFLESYRQSEQYMDETTRETVEKNAKAYDTLNYKKINSYANASRLYDYYDNIEHNFEAKTACWFTRGHLYEMITPIARGDYISKDFVIDNVDYTSIEKLEYKDYQTYFDYIIKDVLYEIERDYVEFKKVFVPEPVLVYNESSTVANNEDDGYAYTVATPLTTLPSGSGYTSFSSYSNSCNSLFWKLNYPMKFKTWVEDKNGDFIYEDGKYVRLIDSKLKNYNLFSRNKSGSYYRDDANGMYIRDIGDSKTYTKSISGVYIESDTGDYIVENAKGTDGVLCSKPYETNKDYVKIKSNHYFYIDDNVLIKDDEYGDLYINVDYKTFTQRVENNKVRYIEVTSGTSYTHVLIDGKYISLLNLDRKYLSECYVKANMIKIDSKYTKIKRYSVVRHPDGEECKDISSASPIADKERYIDMKASGIYYEQQAYFNGGSGSDGDSYDYYYVTRVKDNPEYTYAQYFMDTVKQRVLNKLNTELEVFIVLESIIKTYLELGEKNGELLSEINTYMNMEGLSSTGKGSNLDDVIYRSVNDGSLDLFLTTEEKEDNSLSTLKEYTKAKKEYKEYAAYNNVVENRYTADNIAIKIMRSNILSKKNVKLKRITKSDTLFSSFEAYDILLDKIIEFRNKYDLYEDTDIRR